MLALALGEIYFRDAPLGDDLIGLKITNLRGNDVVADAIRQLKEDLERRGRVGELGKGPAVKNADDADLVGLGLDNRVVARQDGFALRRRFPLFPRTLLRHIASVSNARKTSRVTF